MNTPAHVDRRYRDRGYTSHLVEDDAGAYLTIWRRGIIVGKILVSVFEPGSSAPVSVIVQRLRPQELTKVTATDVFE